MPDDFESNFNEGLQLFKKKQYENAILKFRDATYQKPNSAEAHYHLGLSYLEKANEANHDGQSYLGNVDVYDSMKEFQTTLRLNPKDADAFYYISQVYYANNEIQKSLDAIKKAIEIDPESEKYLSLFSCFIILNHQYSDAISYFCGLIEKNPKSVFNHRFLGICYTENGMLDKALVEFKELIILDPFQSSHYVLVGNTLIKMGRIDEARQFFGAAIQSFPDDNELKTAYQKILIETIVDICEEKKWNYAIDKFQAIIANEERKFGYKDTFGNRCGSSPITELLWKAFEEKKHRIDGINLFFRLYQLDPGNSSLSSNLEESLKDLKIDRDVIDDYLSSIESHKDCADIHLNLVNEIRWESGYEDIVIEEYRKAIVLDPDLGFPHCEIGMILSQVFNDNKEAIQEFSEGIKKDPNSPNLGNYYYVFAVALIRENRIDEAINFFHKATELEPIDSYNFSDDILYILYNNELIDKAEEFIKQTIEIFENLLKTGRKIQDFDLSYCNTLCTLGELFEKQGKLDEAISQYKKAARIREDNAYPRLLLADILFKKNQLADSITEYRKLIGLAAKWAPYRKKLADALMKNGQFLDAIAEYREAVRLDPDNKEYSEKYINLKTVLLDKDAFERAFQSKYTQQDSLLKGHSQSIDDEFQQLVVNGENEVVEFKTSALWSKNFSKEDIENSNEGDIKKFGKDVSKIVIAKTIAGFLNTDGGNLVIGIKENKDGNKDEITGIEGEFSKLKDHCIDGYRRMLIDEIIRRFFPDEIFNHLANYIKIEFPKCNGKFVCWLKIKKSENHVYLKIQNDENYFSLLQKLPFRKLL